MWQWVRLQPFGGQSLILESRDNWFLFPAGCQGEWFVDGEFSGLFTTRFSFQYWRRRSFVVVDDSTYICVVLPPTSLLFWCWGLLDVLAWTTLSWSADGLFGHQFFLSVCTQLYYWAIQVCRSGSRVPLIQPTGWTLSVCSSASLVLPIPPFPLSLSEFFTRWVRLCVTFSFLWRLPSVRESFNNISCEKQSASRKKK